MHYDWNFSRLAPYTRAFTIGTLVTLELTVLVILVGTVVGVILGLALHNRVLRVTLYPFVDVIRALPPLVLILFMYFLLTRPVIGAAVPEFWVCVVAMSLNLAAFISDLVRAAIESFPKDAADAGRSLGMTEPQITRHILFPHVIREIIPGLTSLYIGMLKVSSLASVVNVNELVNAAQTVISDVSRSLEAWIVVGLIYIALVLPATYGARVLERRMGRGFGSRT
jgi:His/Glu/Gln/Arg/opine family amino acid ABC transporter permease subunit